LLFGLFGILIVSHLPMLVDSEMVMLVAHFVFLVFIRLITY